MEKKMSIFSPYGGNPLVIHDVTDNGVTTVSAVIMSMDHLG